MICWSILWYFLVDLAVIGIFLTPFFGFCLLQINMFFLPCFFVVLSYVSVMFSMYGVLVGKLLGFRVFGECVCKVRVCAPACFCALVWGCTCICVSVVMSAPLLTPLILAGGKG